MNAKEKKALNWADGEWDNEPDEKAWIDDRTGYECRIRRNDSMGFLCGYVVIPNNHAVNGLTPSDDGLGGVSVHGGITYSEERLPHMMPRVEGGFDRIRPDGTLEGELNDWVIGFDCGHLRDFIPAVTAVTMLTDPAAYRNIEYVEAQCRQLALQLKELNDG